MATKPQPWSGRFRAPVAERVKRFTASVDFDRRLAKQDIAGSLAHARMLAGAGIISKADLRAIERGRARLAECRARVNQLPLGAAALAGTSFPIDRSRVARELGFQGLCENSLDAVSDRDFAIEFCGCASLAMVHLSRLAEELVLWSNP